MKDEGIILITSIFIVFLISALGIGYLSLVNNQLEMANVALTSAKAFYCAETGVSEAILHFKNGQSPACTGALDNGTYAVEEISASPQFTTIKSTGKVSNFQRIIKVTLDKTDGEKITQQDWEEI